VASLIALLAPSLPSATAMTEGFTTVAGLTLDALS
jgi:hypothetical protein